MSRTVFWSWQSDRDERVTKRVIREALVLALDRLQGDAEVEDRVELDHDTRNVPGTPDIVASILEKIEAASVFVGDITPIAVSEAGKHLSNPNVLIELGYAKKALGLSRLIAVWNTAFTDCRPENLPFDLRGRRGPVSYSLPAGATTADYRTARENLAKDFVGRIGACLEALPKPFAAAIPWMPHREGDPSIWVPRDHRFRLNEPHTSGTAILREDARWYARAIPSSFTAPPAELDASAPLIPFTGGFSWARTAGGMLTYSGSVASAGGDQLSGGTMWFRETGEVWAFTSGTHGEYQGRDTFHGDYFGSLWARFLRLVPKFITDHGGALPIHIRAGITGLEGLSWPVRWSLGEPPVGCEPAVEIEAVLESPTPEAWKPALTRVWSEMRSVFGLPPPSEQEVTTAIAKDGS